MSHVTHLEAEEEGQMFADSESVEEDIVLGTDSQAVPDLVDLAQDVVAADLSRTASRGVQTCRRQI